jgi:hypothetical protein
MNRKESAMSRKLLVVIIVFLIGSMLAGCSAGAAGIYSAASVKNSNSGEESKALVREKSPEAVVDQHLKALNACNWSELLAQYPDQTEVHLSEGTVIKGRQAVADLFAGFVLTPKNGGLCGITFSEESRMVVNGTLVVQWVANADFLSEPYKGSDAYITDDGLMVSMVTTFNGADLKMK